MKVIKDIKQAKKLLQRAVTHDVTARPGVKAGTVEDTVREIIASVRKEGDAALFELTERFDGARLKSLEVGAQEMAAARKAVDPDLLKALKVAAARIEKFHKTCMRKYGKGFFVEGLGQQVLPLERVGIYVPGGTAAYPSTVLMTAIPAKVAGVKEIIMTTPCGKDGRVPINTLAAAAIAGVNRVFRLGGAQAIAALALGTESVPKVDKICGPGNIWVMTAKKLVYGMVDIDALQGPSEVVIIADGFADPALCAADLIAQAEHDAMATSIFITNSAAQAEKVQSELSRQLSRLKRYDIASKALETNGYIVIVKNLDEAIELSNLFAPEHLSMMVRDAREYLGQVTHAGCICLGEFSPVVLGDYIAGPSHALPTGGSARFSSPLTVQDFLKVSSVIALDNNAIKVLGPHAHIMATREGLTGHAHAVQLRLNKKKN
ncbi:MAG: histidinol dehydrogenase [Dehalococcoidia bacterium]|nr:histidinol dehydrogenase [Dehalococcoidia bacterium]MDD5493406.1 histidinol dehydrogenase [Dehalococcoidia bacterium]